MAIEQMLPQQWHSLASIQVSNETNLLNKENVVGVALGRKVKGGQESDQAALLALVNQKMAPELLADKDKVPPAIDGVPTDVLEVGVLFAGEGRPIEAGQGVTPQTLRGRRRPTQGGDS